MVTRYVNRDIWRHEDFSRFDQFCLFFLFFLVAESAEV